MKDFIKRDIKVFMFDRVFILTSFFMLILYFVAFLEVKTGFLNSSFDYMNSYIIYYIQEYYDGNIELFSAYSLGRMYIEEDLYKLLSAEFIYKITHFTISFKSMSIMLPFIIFGLIQRNNHDFFNDKMFLSFAVRIKRKKLLFYKFLSDLLSVLFLTVIPRILSYICFRLFYNTGFSNEHNYDRTILSYQIPDFIDLNVTTFEAVLLDILILILYTLFVVILSYIFVMITKKRGLNLILFILCMLAMYLIYEITLYGMQTSLFYLPNIFKQTSLFLFYDDNPQIKPYVYLWYQGVCIVVASLILVGRLKVNNEIS